MTPAERTTFDAVVGTSEAQVAVAPGALRRTWTEAGRRYFHYATEGPIGNDYAFFSADYAVREARWAPSGGTGQAVAIRIFHHPGHTTNLDRMVRGIRASLDYYTEQFGPYPYSHIKLVEVPGNEIGMHADPTLIRFSEETALLNPWAQDLDLPFAIVAHEVSHQWWGHQLEPAFIEGAPVIGESLAGYSAMRVMEETLGREQLRRLLASWRQPYPYPPIRRGEPLLRGLDPYLAYRKGPFALHALSEYIGEERVNAAIRRLLEKHPPGAVPRATTLDLYRELQAVTPDSLDYLLHDLFEVNAFWGFTAFLVAVKRAWATSTPSRGRSRTRTRTRTRSRTTRHRKASRSGVPGLATVRARVGLTADCFQSTLRFKVSGETPSQEEAMRTDNTAHRYARPWAPPLLGERAS